MLSLPTVPYGQPQSLAIQGADIGAPKAREVVVAMRASSLNGSDWEYVTGHPGYTRVFGLRRPRFSAYGSDVAGEVLAVGSKVTGLKVGERVFGDVLGTFGALAERVVAPAKMLLPTPAGLSDVHAACLCQSGVIAWHAMHVNGGPNAGARVLIVGGGGGSGMFMIQLAKRRGAHVTAVDHTCKLDFMRSMGADACIDYTQEDLADHDADFDYIVDLVAPHPLAVYRSLLRRAGCYLVVGGPVGRMLWTLVAGPFARGRTMKVLAVPQNEGLLEMAELVERGELQVSIARRYPLARADEALRDFGRGRACGKVVVEMNCA